MNNLNEPTPFTNRGMRNMLLVGQEFFSAQEWEAILRQAGLETLKDYLPPDNLRTDFTIAQSTA